MRKSESGVEFAIDALAAYRTTRLLISDGIFDRPRATTRRMLERRGHEKLLELADCPWCLGMWVAGAVVILRRTAPRAWSPLASTLALSATSGLLASFVRESDDEHRVVEQLVDDNAVDPVLQPV
jgi:hypothetical protein